MAKPMSEFGGWLSAFSVLFTLAFVLSIIEFFAGLFLLGSPKSPSPALGAIAVISNPFYLYFFYKTITTVKLQTSETPQKIAGYLKMLLAICVIVGVLELIVVNIVMPLILAIVFYVAWMQYFKKSQRVLQYYGANAE